MCPSENRCWFKRTDAALLSGYFFMTYFAPFQLNIEILRCLARGLNELIVGEFFLTTEAYSHFVSPFICLTSQINQLILKVPVPNAPGCV